MMEKTSLAGMLLTILFTISNVWCETATDVKYLHKHLFTTNDYNKLVRPVSNQSAAVNVRALFTLLAVNTLDEVTETLTTTAILRLIWIDEFLSWDPENYGDITYIVYPQGDVWKPDVSLKNSNNRYERLEDAAVNVNIKNNGEVEWNLFQVFQSTCSVDITHFPFDQQICSLTFEDFSYVKEEVDIAGDDKGIALDWYHPNSVWDITSTRWYNENSAIVFELTLDRKPLNSILTLICPVIMLAILNLFVFALPSDGGEKAGYAVTVFLAFAVLHTIMASSFPENSETVAYISIYVVTQNLQSTLITISALLTIRLASFDDESDTIPGFIIALARISKCNNLRGKVNRKRVEPTNMDIEIHNIDGNEQCNTGNKKQNDGISLNNATNTDVDFTWKSVANALDTLFFVFFLLAFLVATLVCLLSAKYRL